MTEKMVENHEKTLVEHEEILGKIRKGQAAIADDLIKVKANVGQLAELIDAMQQQQEEEAKPPFSWYTYTSKEEADRALGELEEFVHKVLVHMPGGVLADCWRRHPYVVDMLLVLAEAYWLAWSARGGVGTRLDFYTRYLPDVLTKARAEMVNCDLRGSKHNGRRPSAVQVGVDRFADFELAWRTERGVPPIPEPSGEARRESQNRGADTEREEMNR